MALYVLFSFFECSCWACLSPLLTNEQSPAWGALFTRDVCTYAKSFNVWHLVLLSKGLCVGVCCLGVGRVSLCSKGSAHYPPCFPNTLRQPNPSTSLLLVSTFNFRCFRASATVDGGVGFTPKGSFVARVRSLVCGWARLFVLLLSAGAPLGLASWGRALRWPCRCVPSYGSAGSEGQPRGRVGSSRL